MHYGGDHHVHTLEETLHEEEQPFLFHLHTAGGGAGREHEQQRGRSLSNAAVAGGSRPIRSISGRTRRTSTGEHGSRVREVIRDGEIVPVVHGHRAGGGEEPLDALDEDTEWVFDAGAGHTLADPTRFQRVKRNIQRVYHDWSGLFSLISVSLSR